MDILVSPTLNFKRTSTPRGTGARSSGTSKDSRTVTGFSSVFGNVDSIGDIVDPGAFTKAISDFNAGRSRCRFLWNHDAFQPPTAKITELKVVSKMDLPAQLKDRPEVTGGLQVTRQYFSDSFSDRVYQGVVSGAIAEMSFGYLVLDHSYETVGGEKVRVLKSLELMDCSDVTWGCNPATVAAVKSQLSAAHVTFVGGSGRSGHRGRKWMDRAWLNIRKPELDALQGDLPADIHLKRMRRKLDQFLYKQL